MLHQLQASKEGFSIKWQHASRAHPKSENCYNKKTPILTPSWNVIKNLWFFVTITSTKYGTCNPFISFTFMQNFAQKKGLIYNLSGISTLGFFTNVLCLHLIKNVMFPPLKSKQVVKVGIENSGGKWQSNFGCPVVWISSHRRSNSLSPGKRTCCCMWYRPQKAHISLVA